MTDLTNPQSTELMLGEIRGQLRELIHNMNNQGMKLDALALLFAEQKGLPAEVAALQARVAALEAKENRRDGAMGIGQLILKSPLLGWLATVGAILWAMWKDRG